MRTLKPEELFQVSGGGGGKKGGSHGSGHNSNHHSGHNSSHNSSHNSHQLPPPGYGGVICGGLT